MGGIKLSGFKEFEAMLAQLGKSTERTLLTRFAKKALEPVRDRARQLVPVDSGFTRDSIVVSTQLGRSAKRKERAEPKNGVRVYVGTTARNAVPREFGTFARRATPFLRPAWEETKDAVLVTIQRDLGAEIERTAERAAKRRAMAAKRR